MLKKLCLKHHLNDKFFSSNGRLKGLVSIHISKFKSPILNNLKTIPLPPTPYSSFNICEKLKKNTKFNLYANKKTASQRKYPKPTFTKNSQRQMQMEGVIHENETATNTAPMIAKKR